MDSTNILIKGSHGTGKTYLARATAYFVCCENINPKNLKEENIYSSIKNR